MYFIIALGSEYNKTYREQEEMAIFCKDMS